MTNNLKTISIFTFIFILILLTACGGGSSSPLPPSDTTGPVVTTIPAINGNVTIGKTPLIANFNEPIFNAAQAQPDGTNMVLTEKGSTVPLAGTVQYDSRNNRLTFFPQQNLVANIEYIITLSGLFDKANNPFQANSGAEFIWPFMVSDYPIQNIADSTKGVVSQPKFSTNAKQQVLAAWKQSLGTVHTIYASINTNGTWSKPELLDSIDSNSKFDLWLDDVSSNGLGFAVAWTRKDGSFRNIYASIYNSNGWQNSNMPVNDSTLSQNASSAILSSTYQPATSPTPSIAGEGYAIAWNQITPHASVYSLATWGTPTAIGTQSSTGRMRITSNGRGYALVWSAGDPSQTCSRGDQIHADIYSSAKGYWINSKNKFPTIISAGVETLIRDSTQDAFQASVISNGNSYLFAWYGGDQSFNGSYIHATVFTQLDAVTEQPLFDGPYKVSNNGNVTDPQLVSNGSNYAIAWSANSVAGAPLANVDDFYVFVNQYTYQTKNSISGQWGQPLVMNNPALAADSPAIVSNGDGYAMAWHQSEIDGGASLYGRVFRNNVWTDIELLSNQNLGSVKGRPNITFKNNHYSVVWLQPKNGVFGTKSDVYINRFNVAKWEQVPIQIGSAVSGNPLDAAVLTETNNFISLWTQDDPDLMPTPAPRQLYSKQILLPETAPVVAPVSTPVALQGSNVGPQNNFVYISSAANANNASQASLAVFSIDSLIQTLNPVDANTNTPVIDSYLITTATTPATDNLGQTFFIADGTLNTPGKLVSYSVNGNTGKLTQTDSIAIATNNFQSIAVATHQDGYVYVLNRRTNIKTGVNGVLGSISAYRYSLQSKTLTSISLGRPTINSIVTVNDGPQSITLHPTGKYLYVPNTNSRTISIFSVNASTGELTKIIDHNPAIGSTFLTFSAVSNNGKYLYVADELNSTIIGFVINSDGTLAASPTVNKFNVGEGGLPRELLVAPLDKFLYIISTSDQSIHSFSISALSGALTPINKYNIINNPNAGGANNFRSIRGLAISPDGRQIYVADSPFGMSNLYIFDIQQTDNNILERVTGGIYTPGNPASGEVVNNGQTIIASKVGHCPQ
jgi:6-phosphogluconolactonase (cycloisomerase 2 family)